MSKNIHYRDHITDYLIPVINLMKKEINHTEAFKEVANTLRVTKQTVNDRCARGIHITTPEFVNLVKSGRIKEHLLNRFPDKADILNKYL